MENIFIISGPAGSGKDSIIDGVAKVIPIERVVTTTTRPSRPGEENGKQYYFVSKNDFEHGIATGQFVEHSINENNAYYGVTREELERVSRSGKVGVWRIDWKGVISAKKLYPSVVTIFITAPIKFLEERLRSRDTDKSERYFEERMAYTREWFKHTDIYDYTVDNEQGKLDEAIKKAASIIQQRAAF